MRDYFLHPLTAKAVPSPFGSPVIGGQKSL